MRSTILKLDKEYEIRFDTMALLRLERELGKPIVEALKEIQSQGAGMSIDGMFTLVKCGCKELSEKTSEELAALIDGYAEGETTIEKFSYVIRTTVQEMQHSLVGDEKKVRAAAKLIKAQKDSVGTASRS